MLTLSQTPEGKAAYLQYREQTPPVIPFFPNIYKVHLVLRVFASLSVSTSFGLSSFSFSHSQAAQRMPLGLKRVLCLELPMYEFDEEKVPVYGGNDTVTSQPQRGDRV